MPKLTVPQILQRLEEAGITPDAYYNAVLAVDQAVLSVVLRRVRARNSKRRKAAASLQAAFVKRQALFMDADPDVPDDAEIAALFAKAHVKTAELFSTALEAVDGLVAGLRLNSARRAADAVVKAKPLQCRDLGELAVVLSALGVSYTNQARLLLAKPPGGSNAPRTKKPSETEAKAVERLASDLKTKAWRAKAEYEDEKALIAAVFQEPVTDPPDP